MCIVAVLIFSTDASLTIHQESVPNEAECKGKVRGSQVDVRAVGGEETVVDEQVCNAAAGHRTRDNASAEK